MPLQFHRAGVDMGVWSATGDEFSFVITHESPTGPGFHGDLGYIASWRSQGSRNGAVKIGGSPFRTLAEAEQACNALHHYLSRSP